jgi:gliding motility-associated protein GldM
MAGYKETPRQKMIAMMYLVLTALLALNVSKEMLDAFIVVNDSIELTNENFAQKLTETYDAFEKQYQINQNKVEPYWNKANEAKKLSDEMVEYINQLKYELIAATEKIPIDSARIIPVGSLKNKEDYSTTTNFFMGDSEDGSKGKGKELKQRIDDYRAKLMNLIDPKDQDKIKLGLKTDGKYHDANGMKQNWIQYNFFHTILAADVTIINKIITEVYNSEFDIVNFLLSDIDAVDFKYDKIDARVLPKTNYVFQGDEYEAEIIVAAYDTKQNPEVYYAEGVSELPVSQKDRARSIAGQSGMVKLKFPAQSLGLKKFAGFVSVKNGVGDINNYPFSDEYFVAEPSLTVSAIKMNVFYIGVDNPVAISVPGIPDESIEASISVGTLKRDPTSKTWVITVPSGQKETVISVDAMVDGKKKSMGSKTYRIKKLPDPIALIANKNDGPINRNLLVEAGAIIPKMPSDFEFDLNYKVMSFKMTMLLRGTEIWSDQSSDNKLTNDMINNIRSANKGQKIWFENIIVRGPDNIDRQLAPIVLTIN